MPRKKLTDAQKRINALKRAGVDLSDIGLSDLTDTPDDEALEAEAVLLYFELDGANFVHQICPVCKKPFAYKYSISKGKMRCSMRCRRAENEAKGIRWSPGRPLEERWAKSTHRGELPLIVPAEALSALREAYWAGNDIGERPTVRVVVDDTNKPIYETGKLLMLGNDGDFTLMREDGSVVYGWPALRIERVAEDK